MSEVSEQKQLLPEGFVACPYCAHDDQIELVDVYTTVDLKVNPNGELPNVYIVSELKCKRCEGVFGLERVDVRFGLPTPSTTSQINEISFGEFTVYTTLSPEEAIPMAKQWYYDHFDYPLEEPVARTVGTTIFTSDPRVIVIPEEGSEYENQRRD
jgi:hypothetical protein